jgi:hypothetical protein
MAAMPGRYGLNPPGRRCTPVPTGCWRRRLMDEVALAGHKVPEIHAEMLPHILAFV